MRSALRAASQLPGRGPTDVDDAPAPVVNQKSDYDDDEVKCAYFFLVIGGAEC